MSSIPTLQNYSPDSSNVNRNFSPVRTITILAVIIFLAEIISMMVLFFVQFRSYLVTALVDALIMIVLILPGLYLLQLKPIWNQMKERAKAESALRSSEELLKKVLELLPVGVWIIDKHGNIVHGNPAGQNIWGGVRYVDIPHYGEYKAWWADSGKAVQPEEWAASRSIAQGEAVLDQEINIETFDGISKVILNSAVPITDEKNIVQGVVVLNQDITALKRTQQALEKSEMLFRTAMENLPVGVWLTDGSGKIIYSNPSGQAIWEGARYVGIEGFGEYKGWWLNTGKLIEPEDWAVARAINKGETSLNEEIEIECFDGTHKIILNSVIPVRDDRGQILWAFITNQDITELKARERAIIQTHELMERFFSCISTHIAYMDRDFNFIRVNDTYASSGGHPPEYFVGKNHFDLYPNEENQAIFQHVVETGEPFVVLEKPFEYAEFPERGVTYWDWSLQPVRGNGGTVEGVVLSLVDVTERKRAQIQLELNNQELQELSNAERRERELAESLAQTSLVLNTSLEQGQVLKVILEQIRKTVPFRGGNILLLEGKQLRVASFLGFEGMPEENQAVGKTYQLEEFPLRKQICESLQPVKIDSVAENPDWRWIPGLEWIRSYLGVPLLFKNEVIGIISLNSEREGAFTQEAVDHLLAFTAPAALALHNARLFAAESTARQVAETLAAAAQALTKSLDLEQVINTLLDHIKMIVHSDTAGVTLFEDGTHLVTRSFRGYGPWAEQENIPAFPIDGITDAVIYRIFSDRKSLVLPNPSSYSVQNQQPGCEPICSWLIVPIIANDKFIGLVELGRVKDADFSPEHIQWAEALVVQAAMAIQNAWLFQQVSSSSDRLQSLSRKLVEIQENERFHVARELHDEAGQALSLLKMNLGRLEQDPDCPEPIRARLVELKSMTDGVLEELHRLAVDLRPIALDHLGLVAALEQFALKLHSDRFSVQFKALGFDGDRLPKDLETCLYRIVQEALANVIRHSRASNVGILLERRQGKVKLFVEDDGIGFDPNLSENNERLGLVGMRERAEMFEGTLTIESNPGKGTSIIVEVPDEHTNPYSR